MKVLIFPQAPVKCPRNVSEAGTIGVGLFIREFVLPRPAFRARGNAQLLLELWAWLDTPGGKEGKLSDEAYELLQRELAFPDQVLRWELVPVVAEAQQWLASARDMQARETS